MRGIEGDAKTYWEDFWYLLDDGYFDTSFKPMLFVRDGLMTLAELGLANSGDPES